MTRAGTVVALACVLLARTKCPHSCIPDEPCEYDELVIDGDFETPWETTVAMDIAALEVPQHGTWRWGESTENIELEHSGVELPAWATFVHNPDGIVYREHIDGGLGVACDGLTVAIEGTLTITDESDEVIVSVPLTVERQYAAEPTYGASPSYSPVSEFSTTLHELAEWDFTLVFGSVLWIKGERLLAEFFYWTQTMDTETTGGGAVSPVGVFEADES